MTRHKKTKSRRGLLAEVREISTKLGQRDHTIATLNDRVFTLKNERDAAVSAEINW